MNFHERKQERKEYYEKCIKGWKLRPCGACNGSGYYDHNDNPECGACDGTGKERYNSNEEDLTECQSCTNYYAESESTAIQDKSLFCSKECEEDYSNARD